MAGTTMVPFHGAPQNMEIDAETYPTADARGSYSYGKTVPLEGLRSAFRDRFGGELQLDRRVVFIPAGQQFRDRAWWWEHRDPRPEEVA